jgi:tRNA (cytosine49-C5)-methyltransferase
MSLPERIARYREIVGDWPAFLEALGRPLPVDLRWNPLAVERARFEQMLTSRGARWHRFEESPELYRVQAMAGPGVTWPYHLGWYHPQGYTSTLAAELLETVPGECVLDLCAAPGGKTGQIAAGQQGQGLLVANDVSIGRLAILASNLERLGVPNALLTRYPAQNFPERICFDRVLADVPCTGEGTFRIQGGTFNPGGAAPQQMQRVQLRILEKALRAVRPGGVVVYATCSYAPEENEEVVAGVLERVDAVIEPVPPTWPGDPGLRHWRGRDYPPALRETRRLWPHQTESWGFYLARLRRSG